MSGFQAESEIEENDNNLVLFDMRGSKKPQYWKFIKLIAPNNSKNKWKTSECVGAYCMKCKLRLDYKPSNPALIPRHMNTKHKEELMDYEKEQNEKTRKAGTLYQHFHSATPKKLKMASNKNQKQLELLCAMWTATSLRPIKVVEDFFLQHMIDHATATNGKLSLPSRNLNQRNIMKIAEWMTNEIKIQIRREINFYSTTTDLWSSRRMNALIALTLHYLTEEFQMREFKLESSPVEDNHTSGMIQNLLRLIIYLNLKEVMLSRV